MTKTQNTQIKGAYSHYQYATATSLSDVYTTWSYAKDKAYRYCRELFAEYEGEDFRILGANVNTFSVGFIGKYEGKKAFFYITKSYDRVMILD